VKILMLSALYEPFGLGGAERVARTLALAARDKGHDVVVLATSGDDDQDREVDGIRVRSVRMQNFYPLEGGRPSLLKPLWHAVDSYNVAMRPAVSRILAEERPDVMHSHMVTGFSAAAWSAARSAGVPVVQTLHDHYTICARSTMTIDGAPCTHWHLHCRALTFARRRASHHVWRQQLRPGSASRA
jgi:glycosyltransferase involved in cell wall biosynthesis